MRAGFISDAPLEEVHEVADLRVPGPQGGIAIRSYRPSTGLLPVVVFFHGGGWTVNDLDTHDRVCRRLANGSGAVVLSVDFRRSPEHPYPAPIEDAFTATCWAAANATQLAVDPGRICVAGDSSGGTMATVVALLARDRGFPRLRYQVMVYPVTDAPSTESPSYRERESGYSLGRAFMEWFWGHYVPPGADLDDPYLCPLRADDLSGLPPALVVTAEFDPLRDEGRRYAERLAQAGVETTYEHVENQMHGFVMQTAVIDRARQELDGIAATIAKALS
jgi:acetyl esterase